MEMKYHTLRTHFRQQLDAITMHDGSIEIRLYLDAWEWGPEIETKSDPNKIIESYDQNILKIIYK